MTWRCNIQNSAHKCKRVSFHRTRQLHICTQQGIDQLRGQERGCFQAYCCAERSYLLEPRCQHLHQRCIQHRQLTKQLQKPSLSRLCIISPRPNSQVMLRQRLICNNGIQQRQGCVHITSDACQCGRNRRCGVVNGQLTSIQGSQQFQPALQQNRTSTNITAVEIYEWFSAQQPSLHSPLNICWREETGEVGEQ